MDGIGRRQSFIRFFDILVTNHRKGRHLLHLNQSWETQPMVESIQACNLISFAAFVLYVNTLFKRLLICNNKVK